MTGEDRKAASILGNAVAFLFAAAAPVTYLLMMVEPSEPVRRTLLYALIIEAVPDLIALLFLLNQHKTRVERFTGFLRDHPKLAFLIVVVIPLSLGALRQHYFPVRR